jgi:hypothetical protein
MDDPAYINYVLESLLLALPAFYFTAAGEIRSGLWG